MLLTDFFSEAKRLMLDHAFHKLVNCTFGRICVDTGAIAGLPFILYPRKNQVGILRVEPHIHLFLATIQLA